MPSQIKQFETLENILDSSRYPGALDSHPWTKSLVVLESISRDPALKNVSPGLQLLITITKFFTAMMPSTAPRRSQPFDARWGEFGVLAAQYFAPLIFGLPAPASLDESRKYVNQGILSFVLDRAKISEEEKNNYELMGGALASAGDMFNNWHEKGLRRLTEKIMAREEFLSNVMSVPAVITDEMGNQGDFLYTPEKSIAGEALKKVMLFLITVFILFTLILTLIGGFKLFRIYNLVSSISEGANYAQAVIEGPAPRPEKFKNSFLAVSDLKKDFTTLKNEVQPLLWMGSLLKWAPVYGGDLAAMTDMSILADSLLTSVDLSYQVFAPLAVADNSVMSNPTELANFLKNNQSQIIIVQQTFAQAESARTRLEVENLSPKMRSLILNKIDPLIMSMKNGLTISAELPRMMGATDEGPKTYLLLVQNEDELRPTGGFITAASVIRMQAGGISDLNFVDSGGLDNGGKLYPAPPWQLSEYMNSQVLVLRDVNWFTNYPTAASYARYLHSYINENPVNGVIAFDQHFLIEMLNVTGPIVVEGAPYPIDTGNVVQYMRASKTPGAQDVNSSDWSNKAFLNKIAYALIQKLFSGDVQWESISVELLRALNERHLLLQMDNPAMTSLLADNHWDGAVRPKPDADFLMVVDTNVGFNKTNAVVESSLTYDIDLTNPSSPTGTLTVLHKNNAAQLASCKQWDKVRLDSEKGYPITDCYWNYLRVYTPKGTSLISATPQSVPEDWMMIKPQKTGQVDLLSEYDEDITGVQGFGTLQVVPNSSSLAIIFMFALPANVIKASPDEMSYSLKVQKQPGTLAVPISIQARFADNVSIRYISSGGIIQGGNVLYNTDLLNDLEVEIIFSVR